MLTSIIFCFLFASISYAATVDVSAQDFSFSPPTVTINVGDTVLWTNNGGTHTVTSGLNCARSGIWDSGTLSQGQSFSFTFHASGTYPYNCQIHCSFGMTGTVVVTPSNIIQVPNSGTQSSIQNAYGSAVSGDTIQIQAGIYLQTLDCKYTLSVTLIGGYDSNFFSPDSLNSIITGTLRVRNGTVTIKNIVIQ